MNNKSWNSSSFCLSSLNLNIRYSKYLSLKFVLVAIFRDSSKSTSSFSIISPLSKFISFVFMQFFAINKIATLIYQNIDIALTLYSERNGGLDLKLDIDDLDSFLQKIAIHKPELRISSQPIEKKLPLESLASMLYPN